MSKTSDGNVHAGSKTFQSGRQVLEHYIPTYRQCRKCMQTMELIFRWGELRTFRCAHCGEYEDVPKEGVSK